LGDAQYRNIREIESSLARDPLIRDLYRKIAQFHAITWQIDLMDISETQYDAADQITDSKN